MEQKTGQNLANKEATKSHTDIRSEPSCSEHDQANKRFLSCLSPLFQSESWCEAFHMEISFIHTQILFHLHVNETHFHMKGFALGLALKQR